MDGGLPRGAVSPTSFQTVHSGCPHTAYEWNFMMQHARLRVPHGNAQSVQARGLVVFAHPSDTGSW